MRAALGLIVIPRSRSSFHVVEELGACMPAGRTAAGSCNRRSPGVDLPVVDVGICRNCGSEETGTSRHRGGKARFREASGINPRNRATSPKPFRSIN